MGWGECKACGRRKCICGRRSSRRAPALATAMAARGHIAAQDAARQGITDAVAAWAGLIGTVEQWQTIEVDTVNALGGSVHVTIVLQVREND